MKNEKGQWRKGLKLMSDGKMREAVIYLIVLNMLENEKDEIVYSKHLTRK